MDIPEQDAPSRGHDLKQGAAGTVKEEHMMPPHGGTT